MEFSGGLGGQPLGPGSYEQGLERAEYLSVQRKFCLTAAGAVLVFEQ